MKINLNQPHKSIAEIAADDLPDFAVLIGRNGTGKTQLLEALMEGAATITGISVDEIEKYDMVSFSPPDSSGANRHANQFAQMTADAYLLSPPSGRPPIETAAALFERLAGEIERGSGGRAREAFESNLREEVRRLTDFTVFGTDSRESPYKQALYAQVLEPLIADEVKRERRRSTNRPKQPTKRFGGNQAILLSTAMKLTGKLPHELSRDDIMRASHYEGDTLSNTISAVFAAYKVDQFTWAHKRIEKEHVPFDKLIAQYRTDYPPPWEILRKILSEMRDAAAVDGLFSFDFSDPGGYELHMSNFEGFSFRAEMTNLSTGATYQLGSLSSGEKILMALCIASFNQYLGRRRPKLLLLDELDALLHPSMVTALVRTLKALFVSKGTKVLMTSHSPMTVAALEETDIFRVVRASGRIEVCSTAKSEAVAELSDGLATVDVGLRIAAYDEAKVTILTEGNNVKHLKKWVQLHFPDDVHVFEGLESYSSDGQLLTYGRLLGKMNTNTHFIVVWDCDAASKADDLRQQMHSAANVTPFAFKRREQNTIARNGIENNYNEGFLESFSIIKMNNDGAFLSRELPKDRKTEFANHVLHQGTPEDFVHFQDLYDTVREILEAVGAGTDCD